MRLYLIQHGEAKSKEDDPDRPLTDEGLADVRKVAAFVKPLGLRVGAIWHSGRARAAQTAEALAEAVAADEGVVPRDGLAPKDGIKPVRREVEAAEADLMIVGHLPFLSKLASRLLAGSGSADVAAFQYGCVVCLDRDDEGAWRLAWMVTPELLSA